MDSRKEKRDSPPPHNTLYSTESNQIKTGISLVLIGSGEAVIREVSACVSYHPYTCPGMTFFFLVDHEGIISLF